MTKSADTLVKCGYSLCNEMILPRNNKGQERKYCCTEHRRKGMTEQAQRGVEIARAYGSIGPAEVETLHVLTEMRMKGKNGVQKQETVGFVPLEHQRLIAGETSQPRTDKPWLTISEAAEYSGLPKSYLLKKCRAGWLGAINVSTETEARKHPESAYRIKRSDLTEGI